MKKLEGRAFLCLTLVAVFILGICFFVGRMFIKGSDWATFYGNQHIFKNGQLNVGSLVDRNGVYLLKNSDEGTKYSEDLELRVANCHITGDKRYNISTGANVAFRDKIIGYNFFTGTNSLYKRELKLTIDSELNRTAYRALGDREGFVGIYNWKTGEILTMVSTPTVDPMADVDVSQVKEGTYVNKVLQGKLTPGSIFKLVTTEAALEKKKDINSWIFRCSGVYDIDGERVTCPKIHGTNDIYGALANSCNGAYAQLAIELGRDVLKEYVAKSGLTTSYNVDGIKTAEGYFDFDTNKVNLGWAGIGQYKDWINPLSMMVYIGAIAGEGEAAYPRILEDSSKNKISLINPDTARKLGDMMRNNVKSNYGDGNFPNLNLHAKSGTAETMKGNLPNGWFVGYTGDYAFVVCIEKSGFGAQVAGPVANRVLQQLVNGH